LARIDLDLKHGNTELDPGGQYVSLKVDSLNRSNPGMFAQARPQVKKLIIVGWIDVDGQVAHVSHFFQEPGPVQPSGHRNLDLDKRDRSRWKFRVLVP